MMKCKDGVTLFYKRIETMIWKEDPRYQNLETIFGYKSQFVRDSDHKYVFEVYRPVLIQKGNEKLRYKAYLLKNPKSYKEM